MAKLKMLHQAAGSNLLLPYIAKLTVSITRRYCLECTLIIMVGVGF